MKPGDVVGKYRILSRLARGGMAEVWLARFTGVGGFEKDVVLKTILPHLSEDPDFVRMFVNEALLAAKLNHPNIVQIFDLGCLEGNYFIAMEYVPGRSLRQIARRVRQDRELLPVWFLLRVMVAVCDGLQYAHDYRDADGKPLNLVHRDISPENIMVSFTGTVKILDFGIAKATTATSITRAGMLKGKYSYISPEQVRGEQATSRSDLYAAGVVLYEMLSGVRPFSAANDLELLRQVVEGKPIPLGEVAPWAAGPLVALVEKALANDPALRYSEAADLGQDLLLFLHSTQQGTSRQRDVALYLASLFPGEPSIPSDVARSLAAAAPAASSPDVPNGAVMIASGVIEADLAEPDEPSHETARSLKNLLAGTETADAPKATVEEHITQPYGEELPSAVAAEVPAAAPAARASTPPGQPPTRPPADEKGKSPPRRAASLGAALAAPGRAPSAARDPASPRAPASPAAPAPPAPAAPKSAPAASKPAPAAPKPAPAAPKGARRPVRVELARPKTRPKERSGSAPSGEAAPSPTPPDPAPSAPPPTAPSAPPPSAAPSTPPVAASAAKAPATDTPPPKAPAPPAPKAAASKATALPRPKRISVALPRPTTNPASQRAATPPSAQEPAEKKAGEKPAESPAPSPARAATKKRAGALPGPKTRPPAAAAPGALVARPQAEARRGAAGRHEDEPSSPQPTQTEPDQLSPPGQPTIFGPAPFPPPSPRAPVEKPAEPASRISLDPRAAATNFFSVKRSVQVSDEADVDVFTSFRVARAREAQDSPPEPATVEKVREVSQAARSWLASTRDSSPPGPPAHAFATRPARKSAPVDERESLARSGTGPFDRAAARPETASPPRSTETGEPTRALGGKGIGAEMAATRHFEKGLVALRAGRYEEALSEWNAAIELDPDNKVYQSNLKRLKNRMASR